MNRFYEAREDALNIHEGLGIGVLPGGIDLWGNAPLGLGLLAGD
jgi:hypothetical protein